MVLEYRIKRRWRTQSKPKPWTLSTWNYAAQPCPMRGASCRFAACAFLSRISAQHETQWREATCLLAGLHQCCACSLAATCLPCVFP